MQATVLGPNVDNRESVIGEPVLPPIQPQVNLIKVNADIETKKHVFIHWCAFFILIAIFVICAVFMPDSTIEANYQNPCNQNNRETNISNGFENRYCNGQPISVAVITGLEKLNQFLIIYGKLKVSILPTYNINILNYTASLYSLQNGNNSEAELQNNLVKDSQHTISTTCDYDDNDDDDDDEDEDEINNDETYNNNSYVIRVCDTMVMLYLTHLEKSNYLFVVNFTDLMPNNMIMNQFWFNFEIETINPAYSNSVIAVRYTFLAASIITGILFGCRMKRISIKNWITEQKFIVVLSILLPFFNDPLYAATLIVPNLGTAIIGVFFFSNFICLLFLYWLVLFHRIVFENGSLNSNALTKFKIFVCFLLWIFFVVSYIILVVKYSKDPTSTFDDLHLKAYMAFKVLSFLFAFGIFLYLLKYLIQFCKCYETRLWRYKLVGLFNIFFMMCLALFILSGSFEIYNLTGTEVLISISILNLYIYYQQYLWSPSTEGLQQNLTFSEMDNQIAILNNQAYDELRVDDIQLPEINDEKQLHGQQNNDGLILEE